MFQGATVPRAPPNKCVQQTGALWKRLRRVGCKPPAADAKPLGALTEVLPVTRSTATLLVLMLLVPALLNAQRATASAFQRPLGRERGKAAALAVQQPNRLSCPQRAVLAAIGGAVVGAATGWLLGGIVNMGGDSAESINTRRRTIVVFALGGAAGMLMFAALTPPCSAG